MFQLYGQGETPITGTGLTKTMHADPGLLATCGVPRTGVQVRVVDENDVELPRGAVGEIVTRSDCVMQGYLGNAEASAAALRNASTAVPAGFRAIAILAAETRTAGWAAM